MLHLHVRPADAPPIETIMIGSREVPVLYDDMTREYDALYDGHGVMVRHERARWRFTGPKAAETLSGLVSNDVESLQPGQGCYAVALNAKGRVLADVRIFRRTDDLLVDVAPRAAENWARIVTKYVNPRLAKYEDISAATGCVGIYGPRCTGALARCTGLAPEALEELAPFQHVEFTCGGHSVMLVRSTDFGVMGFDIIADTAYVQACIPQLLEGGGRLVGLAAADIARVEAGRPEWGIDMDETTLPQEANLDAWHAISYTKGCYTGQEVVARVHFRGHVNRVLVGLLPERPLPYLVAIEASSRVEAGEVRSSVVSPRRGPIALAFIRREVLVGEEVRARLPDDTIRARVVSLPFWRPG